MFSFLYFIGININQYKAGIYEDSLVLLFFDPPDMHETTHLTIVLTEVCKGEFSCFG